MTLLSSLKEMLRTHRESGSAVVRYGIGAIYAARDLARVCRSFITDDKYRSTTLLRWFKPRRLHQTTVLTWMDRYPTIFSACRDFFGGSSEIRILSFGCSSGEEVLTLRRYFPNAFIIGAELNPRNLALCRKHKVDGRIAFVHSDRAAIEKRGPFDLIFCMAVLQRTPHAVEGQRLTSLKEIYPFEKFDRQVSELDSYLKKGGLLVIHHTQYFFADASVGAKYGALEGMEPVNDGPKFDRHSALVASDVQVGSIFRKTTS
jgi:SAM-dependent methyltransferase